MKEARQKEKQKGILNDSTHIKCYKMQTEGGVLVVWGEGIDVWGVMKLQEMMGVFTILIGVRI